MRKPVVIDLFCGLGGWTRGFLHEGWDAYGFDIERHQYGEKRYPAQLALQDVLTLHGSQFRDCAAIVASPPCQRYSHMAMPFSRGKREASWQRWEKDSSFGDRLEKLNALFNACFRIQREASEAAGHPIPMVVENVKGAQPWVGSAKWHYGSYYLWGDVPALMPSTLQLKRAGRNFHAFENGLGSSPSFNGGEHETRGLKTVGHANIRDGHTHTRHLTNQRESDALKVPGISFDGYGEPGHKAVGFNVTAAQRYREAEGVKQNGSGPEWFDKALDERRKKATESMKAGGDRFGTYADEKAAGTISPGRLHGSRSDSRKAASAMIAEIPLDLAVWIAQCFKPESVPRKHSASFLGAGVEWAANDR